LSETYEGGGLNALFESKILIVVGTILVAAFVGHYLFWLFVWMARIKFKDENNVGKWLGFIERALVALFVCLGLTSQTVFIFAVKAAVLGYRLPEDKNHCKHIAEQMLLGTMISYFIALCIGICGRWAIGLPLER